MSADPLPNGYFSCIPIIVSVIQTHYPGSNLIVLKFPRPRNDFPPPLHILPGPHFRLAVSNQQPNPGPAGLRPRAAHLVELAECATKRFGCIGIAAMKNFDLR